MTSNELRQLYIEFFESKGHTQIPSAPLVPENDPTTLFVSAGMQPLVPYLLGETHPSGKRLVNYQKCIRTGDIDEVGDTTHHTFFEMLGNWSLGDYFKEDSIKWSYQFLTQSLGIDPDRITVSVFAGDDEAPRDEESAQIWKSLGIPEDKIMYLGKEDNWWAAGPTGPCGPDTEIFVDNIEIWNNVFMMFNRLPDGTLEELPNKNVDTGMGVERTLATLNHLDDSYKSDLWVPIIKNLEELSGKSYLGNEEVMRIIADHIKAAVFLIADGVTPSNKLQGYVLRRLLRKSAVKMRQLGLDQSELDSMIRIIRTMYEGIYPVTENAVEQMIQDELARFSKTLDHGLKEIEKLDVIDGRTAFYLYETFGFPLEVTKELAKEKGQEIDDKEFEEEFKKHQDLSRTASSGMFKGGLAHQSETTTKLHTATHLLHQALRQILGEHVQQKGSNITDERLRFDFSHPEKLTDDQRSEIERLVNEKIKENLPVTIETMSKEEALSSGAMAFFAQKYGETVTVYSIGDPSTGSGQVFSKEICGGPHVKSTGEIGDFKITKEESASAGVRRIYATVS